MRKLIIICLLLIGFLSAHARTYVVCAGISTYKHIGSLKLPENDAKSMKELYETNGASVILLTGANATKSQILRTLREHFAKAGANDQIVFSFSGHGFQGGICPYDVKDKKTGISYSELRSILKATKAKHKIIIADACFSGGLRNQGKNNSQSHVSNVGDKSVVLFLSSRGGEPSGESPLMANGYFTSALVRGMKGAADTNRDRCISAKEIFSYVSKTVNEKTQGTQHPVMWGKFNDTFIMMDWRK